MTSSTTYRAGIIGCGRIADTIEEELRDAPAWSLLSYSHAGAYQRCARTHLVAAADPNAERLAAFGRRRGVDRLYADYATMLDRESLDIVSICVPTRSHARVALDVAAWPVKGVYLEKPIAQGLRDADKMIAAFRSHGIKVAVNHMRSWDPTYGAVRRLIADGALGTVRTVMAHLREGALFGGTHLYDLLRFLLGAEVEWVFGELDSGTGVYDPGARGIIGFANGVRAYVDGADGDPTPFDLDITGTEGRIRVGNGLYPEFWQVDRADGRRTLARRGFPGVHDGRSGMLRAVEDLIAAIETGSKPASDDMDARGDLEIAVAFHLSHRAGAPVRLPVAELDYVIEDPWGRDS
ncbi:MAG: Gfo/Idh/MocA family protein [bacterium]